MGNQPIIGRLLGADYQPTTISHCLIGASLDTIILTCTQKQTSTELSLLHNTVK